jgi:hypothetical protein
MMSAAILMMAGVEQTKVSVAPGDLFSGQGGLEDVSFAKSFNESVGVPASPQGNASDDVSIALGGLKGTTPANKLEGVAEKLVGAKGNSVAAEGMPVPSELKGTVAGKIVPPQATPVTASQETITASGTRTMKVEVPAQVEGTSDDVSPGSSIPHATPVAGVTDESPVPQVSIADGDRPLAPSVLSGDSPVVQRRTEPAPKVTEGISLKKPVEAQESSATQKTGQKTVGKILDAIAVQPKPVTEISREGAIPVVGQAVAPAVAPQSEISKAADASGTVAFPAKPGTEISPLAIGVQARQDIASGTKPGVADPAMTVTAGTDPVATPKTDTSPQRIPVVAMAGGSDGENKPQPAHEFGAALLHSMGVVPTAVVSGDTPGEVVPTKMVTAGDAGPHMAGLPAGSTGQDGAGVVAQSMDGAPRMLAATPTSLEVGIQNGTHGWLKVRAEMTDGGVVNASVSASSSAGQEMLHRELPALSAYLQEEKVAVNAVIVHAPSVAGTDARSSSGTDGAGGQTPQRSNEGEQQHQSLRKTILNGSEETIPYRSLQGVVEDGSLPLAAYVNGGSWLSVRA